VSEYDCLLRTLQTRFGVRFIEDIAFLSVEQLVGVTDRFEAAAVKRLFDIATAHIGVEKLHRSRAVSLCPGLARKPTEASRGESKMAFIANNKRSVLARKEGVDSGQDIRTGNIVDLRVANRVDLHESQVRQRTVHDHEALHAEAGVADVDQGQGRAQREHDGERIDGVGRAVVAEQQDGEPGTVRKCLGDAGDAVPRDAVAGDVEVLERGQACDDLREASRALVTEAIAAHDELREASAARDRCLEHVQACGSDAVEAQVEVLEAAALRQDCREGRDRGQDLALLQTVDELQGGHETHA
jgi:hypothetical protein